MCAINGIYERAGTDASHLAVTDMRDVMKHRGPDGEGDFVEGRIGLGHSRLSIIDLTTGAQPMIDVDNTLVITFNGEIFNYREIRQELLSRGHRFSTQSDTEVILEAYKAWGVACLDRFNGMFAFAIWNRATKDLFVARDRFGIKPLYYAWDNGRLLFASEIKAILEASQTKFDLNSEAAGEYFTFQYCLGEKTLFRGVSKLLPGHYFIYDGSNLKISRYYELPFTPNFELNERDAIVRVRELLEDSVRLWSRSDVKVGAYLSGGIDSSTLVSLLAKAGNSPVSVFSGGCEATGVYDDTNFAEITARETHSDFHRVLVTPHDFVDNFRKLIWHMDEPAAGEGLFPQYFVSRLAAEKVKVALGGQGADEIFAGYTRYYLLYWEQLLGAEIRQKPMASALTFAQVNTELRQLEKYTPLVKRFLGQNLFGSPADRYFDLIATPLKQYDFLAPGEVASSETQVGETYRQAFSNGSGQTLLNQMLRYDLGQWLPALLQVEDRMSMAVGLESRVPFLDHRLVELAFSIPEQVRFKNGRTKPVLKEAVRGMIPEAVRTRPDKVGFPVPLPEWGKGPLRDFILGTLLSEKALNRGVFEAARIRAFVESGNVFDRKLWAALCFETWASVFLDGER